MALSTLSERAVCRHSDLTGVALRRGLEMVHLQRVGRPVSARRLPRPPTLHFAELAQLGVSCGQLPCNRAGSLSLWEPAFAGRIEITPGQYVEHTAGAAKVVDHVPQVSR